MHVKVINENHACPKERRYVLGKGFKLYKPEYGEIQADLHTLCCEYFLCVYHSGCEYHSKSEKRV